MDDREVLSGGIPHRGLTPLQAAVGVVQRYLCSPFSPNLPVILSSSPSPAPTSLFLLLCSCPSS